MSTITTTIDPFTKSPSRQNPATFSADMDSRLSEENSRIVQMNEVSSQMNVVSGEVNTNAQQVASDKASVDASKQFIEGYINYKGVWVPSYNVVGYALNDGVAYSDGFNYVSNINNNLTEPTSKTNTAEWNYVEAFDESLYYQKSEVYNKTETYSNTEVYNKTETYSNTEVYNKTETYSNTESDNLLNAKASLMGATFTGQVKGVTPTAPEDLTRKDFVEDLINNIKLGKYLQVLSANVSVLSGTTSIPRDATAPLISEGTEFFSQAITPSATSSKIEISGAVQIDGNVAGSFKTVSIFRDTTLIGVIALGTGVSISGDTLVVSLEDSPNTISSVTYTMRIGTSTGTWYTGQTASGSLGGIPANSKIFLKEIGV